jgi:NAD(P)H-dependent flavin oxidoreductase YrpB (nitropropane dioxygenase family)
MSSQARISTTSWAALLGARFPIIQSPMAGISHTSHMAIQAISAGGIGSIGGANISDPDRLREEIRAVRKSLSHNQNASNVACLNVNLQQYGEFAVSDPPLPAATSTSSSHPEQSFDVVTTFRKHSQTWLDSARQYEYDQVLSKMLKLNPTSPSFQKDLERYQQRLEQQSFDDFAAKFGKEAFEKKYYKMIEVILQERPAMFTTIFGFIEPQLLRVMHRYGIAVGATTTCYISPQDFAAMEKEEADKKNRLKTNPEEEQEEEDDATLVEFTPSLLKKKSNDNHNIIKKDKNKNNVTLLAPPTEAAIHFESGVDFLFLQSTHAGGHQGTVSAPLPIPHDQYCSQSSSSTTGKQRTTIFSSFTDPIIDQTDPTRFHYPNLSPIEAMVELRRNFTRQLSRNFAASVAKRAAVRTACPFPEGHPFSKSFDEKRSAFLDQNCFLIGCGGITTGKDVVEVMNGAQLHGASIGSRFLVAKENQWTDLHKFALKTKAKKGVDQQKGVFTRAFGGRWARAIENDYIRELDERKHVERVLPFPLQQGVTSYRRGAFQAVFKENAEKKENLEEASEYLNMFCGSQVFKNFEKDEGKTTGEIMNEICQEFSSEYIRSKIEGK